MPDIGEILFVDLLKMTTYPGSPFSGNILNDLIMFLLVPSVFIILLIYMILGRLFAVTPGAQQKFRILVGVTIYLFILAGGYYQMFALLAGPYFLFLIFILGLFYFVFGHFGVQRGAGPYRSGGAFRSDSLSSSENIVEDAINLLFRIKEEKQAISGSRQGSPEAQRGITELYSKLSTLKAEYRILRSQINRNPAEKILFEATLHTRHLNEHQILMNI